MQSDRQQIIEVVSNPTGQLARHLHFLGLVELCFRASLIGDIRVDGRNAQAPAFGIDDGKFGDLNQMNTPVREGRLVLAPYRPHLFQDFAVLCDTGIGEFLGKDIVRRLAEHLARGHAVPFLGPLVDQANAALQVLELDGGGRVVDK